MTRIHPAKAAWLLFTFFALGGVAPARSDGPTGPVSTLRTKRTVPAQRFSLSGPAGIAYLSGADRLVILGMAEDPAGEVGVAVTDGFGQPVDAARLTVADPSLVVWDPKGRRLLALDVADRSLRAIPGDGAGTFDVQASRRLPLPAWGLVRPAGMTIDPGTGEVFVLDRLSRRIVRFTPGTSDVPPAARWIGLGALAASELRGLAFDPTTRRLFTLGPKERLAYGIEMDGRVSGRYDYSAIPVRDPRALVFTSSGDRTDDPATVSLNVADAGAARVVEMAWGVPAADEPDRLFSSANLVRTTQTSAFSPPSPDPSGITYNPATGRLIIVDGEVDEMGIFASKNAWETTLTGSVQRSWSTTNFSIEPTGCAINTANKRLWVSDDDAFKIWEINPGSDNLHGTSDDTRRSFSSTAIGIGDPEGVSFDPVGNRLFVADGVNQEIYVIRAGSNGIIDGGGDDVITHFDTTPLNVVDPETVEYREDNGNLLLLGRTGKKLREVTTSGTLVLETDLAFADLDNPAGMAYAPTSNDPTGRSVYIVSRGVDNDSDPSENDGTLIEVRIGSGPAPPSGNTFEKRIASGSDDAEESSSGSVMLTSVDLELVNDGNDQRVGLRFTGIDVAKNSTITNAYIQFQADEAQSETTNLLIQGQAADNPGTFTTSTSNVSGRARTSASVNWSPPAWNTVGSQGANQRTPDLKAIVQQLVNRGGWSSGNSMVFIITGTGHRTAETFEGSSSAAPKLHIEFAAPPPPNTAPAVNAGTDQTITLPASASLNGTVTDDGQPGPLTYTWSKVSGPGTVTFVDANAVDTQASFSAAGTYVLQLLASDGQLSATDQVSIAVQPPASNGSTFDKRVTSGSDDAEESSSGSVSLTSVDLELVYDGTNQRVGLRFTGVNVPKNATITNAYLQFQADETHSETTNLSIQGQAADNPGTFTTATNNVSGRARTAASASWSPAAWNTVGQQGANQRTSDLKAIVQELVNRAGWASGNAMVFIITGTGHRTAETFEGSSSAAPLLHIEFSAAPPPNTAPSVNAGTDQTITLPASASLDGTVTDDGQPGPLSYTWSKVIGPGTVTFGNANAVDTQASFGAAGTYVLQLLASDGQLSATDQVSIVVQPPSSNGSTFEKRVATSSDDAEESSSGSVAFTSGDLELVHGDGSDQQVGMRFTGVSVPKGAVITRAYIQFEADEAQSEVTSLLIHGQAADNPATFTTASTDISGRARTTASASWSPAAWNTIGAMTANERTVDLKAIVQELVNRAGWASGNAMVFIITGTGHRTASAIDGSTSGAALLHIEY